MSESIGRRLRRLREERGLSQRELGEPGVSYAYISRVEAGVRNPSEKALRALAAKLGVTPLYLETGSDDGVCPHCGREAMRLGIALLALALAITAAGCGGGNGKTSETSKPSTASGGLHSKKAIRTCLQRAGVAISRDDPPNQEYPLGDFEADFRTNFANVNLLRNAKDAAEDVGIHGSGDASKSYTRGNVAIYWGNTPTAREKSVLDGCLR